MQLRNLLRMTHAVAAIAMIAITAPRAGAQQVALDRPVRAGDLTLFPSYSDDMVYYYVPDKATLATDDSGRPRFSFLRWATPEQSASGSSTSSITELGGGGIVHAVVMLEVPEEMIDTARTELGRVRPGARIEGPVIFKSGTFALVSAVTDDSGELAHRVVGLGKAPILDGQQAAVSIFLTKLGAQVLWQSFQSATPDISFSFEMDLDGYRSPRQALLQANFDQIYQHQSFGAGVASTYLAAEISAAFDDLRREGAINLTQVGDDEHLEGLISTAYKKVTDMMFNPLGGTGTPSLASLTSGMSGGNGLLDRATRMLNENRAAAQKHNAQVRAERQEARLQAQREARARREAIAAAARKERESGGNDAAGNDQEKSDDGEPASRPPRYGTTDPVEEGTYARESLADGLPDAGANASDDGEAEVTVPSFAVVASYEMKRVRQRGIFTIDLNKYTVDTLTMRFDANIGDLSRYVGDDRHFREVNLDDPLYKQREVTVFVDGLNADDFGEFVNFVTVQMRKRHEDGRLTLDEVRIDRNNFNEAANSFKLTYGWKDDDDRRRWLEYDHRALWSFFGGAQVESEWSSRSFGAIGLAPPYQRRTIDLEADPALVAEAEIRLITVEVFYDVAGEQRSQRVTMSPRKEQFSDRIEYVAPLDEPRYEYEITWRLRSNRTVSSGRQTSTEAVLLVDELPEA